MPPKIGSAGRAHARLPNQAGIAASDQSASSPQQEHSGVSQSSGQSSRVPHKKGEASRRKLYEQQTKAEKKLAQDWYLRFALDYSESLVQVATNMGEFYKKAQSSWDAHSKERKRIAGQPQNDERREKVIRNILDSAIDEGSKALSFFDKSMFEGENIINFVSAALKRFDSLSNKNKLYSHHPELKEIVDQLRGGVGGCGQLKATISVLFINAGSYRVRHYDYLSREREYMALITAMNSFPTSSKIQDRVGKLIAEFDKMSEKYMDLVTEGNKNIELCDSLLAIPYLTPENKAQIKQCQEKTRFLNSSILLSKMPIEQSKIQLLASLAVNENRERQGGEALKQWYQSMFRLLEGEYDSLSLRMIKLSNEENEEQNHPGTLSQDELEIRRQAATEGLDKFRRVINAIKRHAAEYADLKGIAKDEKLLQTMNAMAETVVEFVRSREYADSMWDGRIQNSKAKARDEEARKKEWIPQGAPMQQNFHRTVEGVVVGYINRNGELKEQNKSGKVISTYFKDQDSENWVKDYGDEVEPAPSLQSAGPSATGESEIGRKKADALLKKADRIVEASKRSVEKSLADIDVISDYDDKLHILHRAFSVKAKAIAGVRNLVAELEKMQAEKPRGEDLTASMKEQVKRLQEDKNKLYVLLQQTQQDARIHSLKGRDPTEVNFKSLQEKGQVASIVKEFERRQNRGHKADWLDRYAITFTPGPQGEQYEPWIVHAHYDSNAFGVAPERVHMKRNAEKDWGVERPAYHSLPLSENTFELIKQEAQKQEASSARKGKGKARARR